MKKNYIAPQTDVENVITMHVMAATTNLEQVNKLETNLDGTLDLGGGGDGTEEHGGAPRTNGSGNLWED